MAKVVKNSQETTTTMTTRVAQSITLLAAFFWGTSFIVVEFGLELINPIWFAQFRFLIASLGALSVVVILKKHIERTFLFSSWVWLLGLFNALGFLGQFIGQTMTNATKTALLINLNLVTVAILSTLLLGEYFSRMKGFAVLLSIFGFFLLTTNGELSQLQSGEFVGDMFALAGGFAWAFYIVTNKKVVLSPKIDVVTLTACVMLTTTVVMVPFTLIFGGINPGVFNIGVEGVWYIVYLGIFCNVIPFTLWTFGLRHLPTTTSTIILLTEVVVAAVLAMILLHEFLTIVGIFGGILIVLAIFLISFDSRNRK